MPQEAFWISQKAIRRSPVDILEYLGKLQEAWRDICKSPGCFLEVTRCQNSKFSDVYKGSWVLPGAPRDPPELRQYAKWRVKGVFPGPNRIENLDSLATGKKYR